MRRICCFTLVTPQQSKRARRKELRTALAGHRFLAQAKTLDQHPASMPNPFCGSAEGRLPCEFRQGQQVQDQGQRITFALSTPGILEVVQSFPL